MGLFESLIEAVFVYLHFRHLGTSFLRSLYYGFSKCMYGLWPSGIEKQQSVILTKDNFEWVKDEEFFTI